MLKRGGRRGIAYVLALLLTKERVLKLDLLDVGSDVAILRLGMSHEESCELN